MEAKTNEDKRKCMYYTAADVQDMLGISRGKAYQILRELNEELGSKGFIVISGKVPKQFFNEHYYGLAEAQNMHTTRTA
jgi:fructose-1-phosphate kinase PfkB-like protein